VATGRVSLRSDELVPDIPGTCAQRAVKGGGESAIIIAARVQHAGDDELNGDGLSSTRSGPTAFTRKTVERWAVDRLAPGAPSRASAVVWLTAILPGDFNRLRAHTKGQYELALGRICLVNRASGSKNTSTSLSQQRRHYERNNISQTLCT